MAFTDNCDLYFAVSDDGANRIGQHIMQQRPSLFNYATPDVASNRELWCQIPEFSRDVTRFGNPIFTILPYLPVIGVDSPPVGLGLCVQVTRAQVDFHPNNTIGLPHELALEEQHLALQLRICGGIGCPDRDELDKIPVLRPRERGEKSLTIAGRDVPRDAPRDQPPLVPVSGKMTCFCIDVFVTATVAHELINGTECIVGKVDGVEIVDVEPEGLEANLECYIRTAVTLFLRQRLSIPLETLFLDIGLFGLGTISLFPTPNPPLPHNPAVEDDLLKAFVTMTV